MLGWCLELKRLKNAQNESHTFFLPSLFPPNLPPNLSLSASPFLFFVFFSLVVLGVEPRPLLMVAYYVSLNSQAKNLDATLLISSLGSSEVTMCKIYPMNE